MLKARLIQSASQARAFLEQPRSRRFGRWLGIFLVLFGFFGYFAAPPLLKSLLVDQLGKELNRQVSIERIDINPYALSLKIGGFSVKAADGHEVVGFDEMALNLSSASLFKLAAVVDEFSLQGPRIAVARVADGRYDISDLLDKWLQPKDEPDSGLPRFSLNNIRIAGGKLLFDDQPKGRVHTVSDLDFALPFLSSLAYQAEIYVEPHFAATINGAPLALKGRSRPFSGSHESELDLDLDRFDLAQLQPYLPEKLPLRLNGGRVDSELKAVFRETAAQVYSLDIVGGIHVSDLALSDDQRRPVLAWQRLDVELDGVAPLNRKFAIGSIKLAGPVVDVAADASGRINLQTIAERLSGPAAGQGGESAAASPAAAPTWSLGSLRLSDGSVRWRDDSQPKPLTGAIKQLSLQAGKLDSQAKKPLLIDEIAWQLDFGDKLRSERMALKEIRLDQAAHAIEIGELSGKQLRARLLREADGHIDWLAAPQTAAAPAKAAAKAAPAKAAVARATPVKAAAKRPAAVAAANAAWIIRLDKLALDDVGAVFEDRAVQPAATQEISGLALHGEGLSTAPGKPGKLSIAGKINGRGTLNVGGTLQLNPVELALKVETVAIPLMPLQPYFGQFLNVALTRGQLSNQGDVALRLDPDGAKAAYKGSLTLGDLLAVDRANSADFLKWKSLYVGGIDFRLEPLAVSIGEIALSDFYSRLILNKEGRLNLADIVRKPAADAAPAPAAAPAGTAAPAANAAAAPAKAGPPIKIARVTLQNGTVNFSDFFVRPNYTVNIGKLGGRITGLSSQDDTVADLDLRGTYANSAPVQIVAKLNPLAAKTYLDLKADVTGVDLVGFSPYSGKYAGYAIEKGKLSLNVGYKLENRQLAAENHLFIDQLTFGDKVESPDATTLPVNLAIALLKNNRGEIDLNLPISGSLDDPQFSVGGLVVKVIVNLFVKAVTSPFALLGSMFGGGEELSNVDFAPGRAAISEAAGKKLEALAKALAERSALKLEVTGRADPESDLEGLKRVAVERAMQAEKLKDMVKKGGDGVSLESITFTPAEYPVYLTRAYREAKFPKPRNMIGLQKDLPLDEMEKLMLANLPVGADDVRDLATRRAEAVQSWLVEQGKVAPGRVFLLPAKSEADAKAKGGRVDFSLR